MYPVIRLAKEFFVHRNASDLGFLDTHVSHHMCWPWDIDLWMELNNGRTLTLYDLGRTVLAKRTGLISALRKNRWGMTMAGASVRYRKRVRMFDRFSIRSRLVYWDDKFFYIEQSMWKSDTATSHILYRLAVTDKDGIVAPVRVLSTIAGGANSGIRTPPLPDWVDAWIKADAKRPWPPMS